MPDIRAAQSTAAVHATEKRIERNTANLEDWQILMLNEIRRLRIGDTEAGDRDVLT